MSIHKNEEAKAFALRLQAMLKRNDKSLSPTALTRDFNGRWRGAPVTVNASRKWLLGQAIPTMDKLTVLASLLNTSQDWLRWGVASVQEPANPSYGRLVNVVRGQLPEAETQFSQDFQQLNAANQKLVGAVMEVLLSEQDSAAQTKHDRLGCAFGGSSTERQRAPTLQSLFANRKW